MEKKLCKTCQVLFQPSGPNQKFCPACSIARKVAGNDMEAATAPTCPDTEPAKACLGPAPIQGLIPDQTGILGLGRQILDLSGALAVTLQGPGIIITIKEAV